MDDLERRAVFALALVRVVEPPLAASAMIHAGDPGRNPRDLGLRARDVAVVPRSGPSTYSMARSWPSSPPS